MPEGSNASMDEAEVLSGLQSPRRTEGPRVTNAMILAHHPKYGDFAKWFLEHPSYARYKDAMEYVSRRAIGYWWSPSEPDLPDPAAFVDESWAEIERKAVADAIDSAPTQMNYLGSSTCRICGQSNGNGEKSDGTYIWPEGFSHYVRDHSIRPPQQFVSHLLGNRTSEP